MIQMIWNKRHGLHWIRVGLYGFLAPYIGANTYITLLTLYVLYLLVKMLTINAFYFSCYVCPLIQ